MPSILLAEDEHVLGQLVEEALNGENNFKVDWVQDGLSALERFRSHNPDICILDVMMPSMNGFEVAKRIRESNAHVPIIFLTARSQTKDVIKGFTSGGDDYLKKPFSLEELIARVRALLKRARVYDIASEEFVFGMYGFSSASQTLRCPKEKITLTNREAQLLKLLLLHKNNVVLRSDILRHLWGNDSSSNSRTMDVYIVKLRKYLVHDPTLSIINLRGYGFKLAEENKMSL